MFQSRNSVAVLFASVIAIALAGCSSADSAPDLRSESKTLEGAVFGTSATPSEDAQNKAQELVSQCMANLGWDYVAYVEPEDAATYLDEDPATSRQGLRIVTPLIEGYEEPEYTPETTNPNDAIVAELSEMDQAAYAYSLHGDPTLLYMQESSGSEVIQTAGKIPNGWGGGCYGQAMAKVFGDPLENLQVWRQVDAMYVELSETIQADARIHALKDDYAACMADQGIHTTLDTFMTDALVFFSTERDEILHNVPNKPLSAMNDDELAQFHATATEEDWLALEDAPQALPQQRALALLAEEEIRQAQANGVCVNEYNERYTGVAQEVEAEFREARADDLARLATQVRD